MKSIRFFSLVFATIHLSFAYAQQNITTRGIADSVLSGGDISLDDYQSQINYPPFIGFSLTGKKMLFNGGRSVYSMRRPDAEIKEYLMLERSLSAPLSPTHDYFLFEQDTDGDENYQLSLYDIKQQRSLDLSPKGAKTYDATWSDQGDKIAYKSNRITADRIDLFVRSIAPPGAERLVMKDITDDGRVLDWSTEHQAILAVRVISENDKQLFLINDRDFTAKQIAPDDTNVAYSDARFIPGQKACLIVTDVLSEYLHLCHYDLSTQSVTGITTDINWDVEEFDVDARGQWATFSINAGGFSQPYLLDLRTLEYQRISNVPDGVISNLAINNSGTEIGFNLTSSTFRRKVFGYSIKKSLLSQYARKGKLPRDEQEFTPAEPFTYPSSSHWSKQHGDIPGFIYRSAISNGPSPVLIIAHGGPEYQWRPHFSPFHQYLANELGVTIIAPNVRGSTGYGKSYLRADDGLSRMNATEDIGVLLDWIQREKTLDENRVVIYGESYGGYLTLSAMTTYGDRICGGVSAFGITNWLTYLRRTAGYRRDLRRVEFGDERNPDVAGFLSRISPLNKAKDIRSPLLLIQGRNDPRVDFRETEQLYEAMIEADQQAWYLLAEDEGHGFTKYENYLFQRRILLTFLKKAYNSLVE